MHCCFERAGQNFGSRPRPPSRTDQQRKTRGHIRQLEALGCTVTLTRAA
jgi:hypothetical protein